MKNTVIFVVALVTLAASTAIGYVNYEFYVNANHADEPWDVLPDFDALTPKYTGTASSFDISVRDQGDHFAFRFSAFINLPKEGTYTFYTISDDGSNLYIDGDLVVDNDGLHGMEEASGTVELLAGEHLIVVTMFEKGGGQGLLVAYQGPGIDKQLIPESILSPVQLPVSDKAIFPVPGNGATAVDPSEVLSWQAPTSIQNAVYDISFGTDPNFDAGPLITSYADTVFDPFDADAMQPNTEYFWRIDVTDLDAGTPPQEGDKWSFKTRYGLVAWYDFETDPNDVSGNGFAGVYQGAVDPNIVVDPVYGNVLLLNEDGPGDGQYVDVAELGISGSAARTISGWVKASTTSIADWTGVFGFAPKDGGGNNYFDVECNPSGEYVLHVHGWEAIFCPVDTEWHHFAATYDGAIITLYLDGKLVGTGQRHLSTTDEFTIGTRQSHNTYFPGYVDDVRIWDYALSSEEVRKMVLLADFDEDQDVDGKDLATFADGWLTNSVVPDSIQPTIVVDDFESPIAHFFWLEWEVDEGITNSKTLYTGGLPDAPVGQQAMRLEYDMPAGTVWNTLGKWTVTNSQDLSSGIDITKYDEIRMQVRRHPENTEDVQWIVHMGVPPGVEGANFGPYSTVDNPADPNQWTEVVIDLRGPEANWLAGLNGPEDVPSMIGLLISTYKPDSDVSSSGILDFDHITFVDHTPDCDGFPEADINEDCYVDLKDYAMLAFEWLRENP